MYVPDFAEVTYDPLSNDLTITLVIYGLDETTLFTRKFMYLIA